MQLVNNICKRLDVSLPELMTLCPTACGKSHNFNIMYTGNSLSEMLDALDKNINALSNSKKQQCVRKFSEEVTPQGTIEKSKLNGTRICFSSKYEKTKVRETLILIQLLANYGCKYNTKVSENDYYVASDEELIATEIDIHSRYYSATKEDGRNVKILSFDELFVLLKITEEEFFKMKLPKIATKKRNEKKKKSFYSTGNDSTTLGDVLRARGIDLSKAN